MAYTIPLNDLRNTEKVYKSCAATSDPIFVSVEGQDGMVLLNMATYRQMFAKLQVYQALEEGERDIAEGRESDAFAMLDRLGTPSHV